ncbi:MAG TPA: alpha/beta fold hydrolase, partial [Candidatus Acidoferrales bacterium]|nr:alpha/beta fold hydrolase [Candidatus Acidoferrales bacterium]
PLVLLHGFGHSSTAWLRAMPLLSRRFRTIALDLPDYRRDAPWVKAYDPASFAAIVTRCIDLLGLGPVYLAGNSFGGLLSMLAALARPELVRGLVLADPVGFTIPPVPPLGDALLGLMGFWLALPHRPAALIRGGYAASFYDQSRIDEATVEEIIAYASTPAGIRMRSRTLHEIFHFSRRLDGFHARLASLRVPTLVVWGKNDPVLPVKDAEIARRVLPAPRLELLEHCGHLPHVELPAVFSSLVLDFLNPA